MILIDAINHSVREAVKKSLEEGRSHRDVLVMMTVGGATWLALETLEDRDIRNLFRELKDGRRVGGTHAQVDWPGLEADACVLLTQEEPIQIAVVRGCAQSGCNDIWQVFDFLVETAGTA